MELTYRDGTLTVTLTGTLEDIITGMGRSFGFTVQWNSPVDGSAADESHKPDRNGNTGPCCVCGVIEHNGRAWYENYRGQLLCWPCADGHVPYEAVRSGGLVHQDLCIHRMKCPCDRGPQWHLALGSPQRFGDAMKALAYYSEMYRTVTVTLGPCC